MCSDASTAPSAKRSPRSCIESPFKELPACAHVLLCFCSVNSFVICTACAQDLPSKICTACRQDDTLTLCAACEQGFPTPNICGQDLPPNICTAWKQDLPSEICTAWYQDQLSNICTAFGQYTVCELDIEILDIVTISTAEYTFWCKIESNIHYLTTLY